MSGLLLFLFMGIFGRDVAGLIGNGRIRVG